MNKEIIMKKILGMFMIILGVYLIFALFMPADQNADKTEIQKEDIIFTTEKNSYNIDETIKVFIENNTEQDLVFHSNCPYPPFDIFINNQNINKESTIFTCEDKEYVVEQEGGTLLVDLGIWNQDIFNKIAEYEIRLDINDYELSTTFTKEDRNFFLLLWYNIIYVPTYNILIFFVSISPFNSFAIAIILLTILIRLLILIPNQKALEQQKRLREVQPKIKEIQEKYKNDQKKIGEETMKLWKKEKVNPLGSCLPMIIQLPIMIGLYLVIRNATDVGNVIMLYPFLRDFSIENMNTFLFGINLVESGNYILPIFIASMQFFQIKLSFDMKKTDSNKENKKSEKKDAMAIQQNVMMIAMPLMVAYFTFILPAGVGLYWGVSTLIGIIQQVIVNKN